MRESKLSALLLSLFEPTALIEERPRRADEIRAVSRLFSDDTAPLRLHPETPPSPEGEPAPAGRAFDHDLFIAYASADGDRRRPRRARGHGPGGDRKGSGCRGWVDRRGRSARPAGRVPGRGRGRSPPGPRCGCTRALVAGVVTAAVDDVVSGTDAGGVPAVTAVVIEPLAVTPDPPCRCGNVAHEPARTPATARVTPPRSRGPGSQRGGRLSARARPFHAPPLPTRCGDRLARCELAYIDSPIRVIRVVGRASKLRYPQL